MAGETAPRRNALGQPIGAALPGWRGATLPPATPMEGRFCRLEPISPDRHAAGLSHAFRTDREDRIWTYLPYGPFPDTAALADWIRGSCLGPDPLFHTVLDPHTGTPLGVASYLRIAPAAGTIEVGHINFSPALQRTPAATEAMYLMMRRVFEELGYRRYEWKCDALNAGSRRAAARLGFTFEGIFRQASVYKGRNRDTAWFSIIDSDWPAIDLGFRAWLDAVAADPDRRQAEPLSAAIARAQSESLRQ